MTSPKVGCRGRRGGLLSRRASIKRKSLKLDQWYAARAGGELRPMSGPKGGIPLTPASLITKPGPRARDGGGASKTTIMHKQHRARGSAS